MSNENFIDMVDKVEQIFNSDFGWEDKYDLIFKDYSPRQLSCILGRYIEYYDPDTSYEEDLTAYVNALVEIKNSLYTEPKNSYTISDLEKENKCLKEILNELLDDLNWSSWSSHGKSIEDIID